MNKIFESQFYLSLFFFFFFDATILLTYERMIIIDASPTPSCVDAVAETALLPSYVGSIGEIQIPG